MPSAISDEQAATFFVNPASALVMTQYILKVPRGAWLLQTAAGSALGRMVIRLGRHVGFRTINVVRRKEQAEELLAAHAAGDSEALRVIHEKHPRFLDAKIPWLPKNLPDSEIRNAAFELSDQ